MVEHSQPVHEASPEELTPEGREQSEAAALERIFGAPTADEALEEDYPLPADQAREPVVLDRPLADDVAEPETAPAPAPAPETQPDDEAYRLAAACMRRDGWSTEDVAALPRARVIAIGQHRAKVQGDVDASMEELVQYRSGKAARENEARRGENEAEAPATGLDVKALSERLGLDEDGARELAETLRSAQSPLLTELAASRNEAAEARRLAMQAAAESARRDLAERFPQVQDAKSDQFRRVLARMDWIQKQGGRHTDVKELMEDAVLLEFRDDLKAKAAEHASTLRTARANGQLTTTPAKTDPQSPRKKMTRDELEDTVLERLFDPRLSTYEERLRAAREVGR